MPSGRSLAVHDQGPAAPGLSSRVGRAVYSGVSPMTRLRPRNSAMTVSPRVTVTS